MIVLYTALFGDRDKLWPVERYDGIEYYAIVDRFRPDADGWDQIVVETDLSPRRAARKAKTLPHHYTALADIWIWVDANVRITTDPHDIITDSDFSTFKHPVRDCLYEEARICLALRKGKAGNIMRQVEFYREQKMPERYGLFETRVVLRRNTPKIRLLNEYWWANIEKYSVRDQISLPYVLWSTETECEILSGRAEGSPLGYGPYKYYDHIS